MTDAAASDTSEADGRLPGWIGRFVDVRPGELRALGWSWLYICSVLASYYVLRPIRDQMGIAGGVENLPWLFTATLLGMLALNVPFGILVRRLPRAKFIPITYRFFALNMFLFAASLQWATPAQAIWVGRVFFVWLSIYNLFVVSIFWAMIVDVFNSEQGKRLFGFIAAGATLGAVVGSAATASLARSVPPAVLMIGAAMLLEVAVFAVRHLSRYATHPGTPADAPAGSAIGGGIFAGFTKTFSSPYLFATGLFLLLYAMTSTLLYFSQVSIVSASFGSDRGAQTAFFASIDLAVNVLTLAIQLFLTNRIMKLLGIALTLAILPVVSVLGFTALTIAPSLACVVTVLVLRRAGNFAIARPAREVLFTVVPREDRYKAKGFIDTVVYRTGDQIGAWSTQLIRTLGLGAGVGLGIAAVTLSLAWLAVSLWLGRRQDALARSAAAAELAPSSG